MFAFKINFLTSANGAEARTSVIFPLLKTIIPFSITWPLPTWMIPLVRAMVLVCAADGCIFSCAETVSENSEIIGNNIFIIVYILSPDEDIYECFVGCGFNSDQ